jgi:predicted nucleic acid-binding protein
MSFAIDSSCAIASLSIWHPANENTMELIEKLKIEDPPLILPAPVLIETYSVLTRMPQAYKAMAREAFEMIRVSFSQANVIALPADAFLEEIARAAALNISGGAIYDAIIARCARLGGADKLLTLNPSHFNRFAGADLEIIVPK